MVGEGVSEEAEACTPSEGDEVPGSQGDDQDPNEALGAPAPLAIEDAPVRNEVASSKRRRTDALVEGAALASETPH